MIYINYPIFSASNFRTTLLFQMKDWSERAFINQSKAFRSGLSIDYQLNWAMSSNIKVLFVKFCWRLDFDKYLSTETVACLKFTLNKKAINHKPILECTSILYGCRFGSLWSSYIKNRFIEWDHWELIMITIWHVSETLRK